MTTELERIADKARRFPTRQFTSLAHHLRAGPVYRALAGHDHTVAAEQPADQQYAQRRSRSSIGRIRCRTVRKPGASPQ